MATSSRTDVSAFTRLPYGNKSSRRLSQNHFVESKESSKWFNGIYSNTAKRAKSALGRSKSYSNAQVKRLQDEMDSSVGKNIHERTTRRLNTEKHLDLHYLNTATDCSEQLNGKMKYTNAGTVSKNSSEDDCQVSHLTAEEHSDEIGTSAAQLKQNGKRGFRKKLTNTEGGKRLKQTANKKDNSWRQNTRSRRLVANARERSRIHILSDAFENLRRAVPSYSQDQKLSKLAILKLATYYISALANLAESDTSARSLKQFADCVAHCTNALQTEGRSRRKNY